MAQNIMCPQCGASVPEGSQFCKACGAQVVAPQTIVKEKVVVADTKSVLLAVILASTFGPLGLVYCSILGAVIMFVFSLVIFIITFGYGGFLVWPLCSIWAFFATRSYNQKLYRKAQASV